MMADFETAKGTTIEARRWLRAAIAVVITIESIGWIAAIFKLSR